MKKISSVMEVAVHYNLLTLLSLIFLLTLLTLLTPLTQLWSESVIMPNYIYYFNFVF